MTLIFYSLFVLFRINTRACVVVDKEGRNLYDRESFVAIVGCVFFRVVGNFFSRIRRDL